MILTGHEDLRIVKTIEGIKNAFESLICEKDYEKITVKELCDLARINKKTFYHYYETLDALLTEMQAELSTGYLERIKGFSLPEDLDKVNREFFLYSAEQGLAVGGGRQADSPGGCDRIDEQNRSRRGQRFLSEMRYCIENKNAAGDRGI